LAKKIVVKTIINILTSPFILVSLSAEKLDLWSIKTDKKKCIKIINQYRSTNVPYHLLESLVVAEDRRNSYHKGIDPIAMVRAIFVKVTKNESQGASTIEQQFVRVVSKRYEKRLSRKMREQILALAVSKKFSKEEIAIAYLCIAFYGSGKVGIKGIHRISRKNIEELSLHDSIAVVSRLKYPEPLKATKQWKKKHLLRNEYILKKLEL
jgi:penicillin-binding protein 1A